MSKAVIVLLYILPRQVISLLTWSSLSLCVFLAAAVDAILCHVLLNYHGLHCAGFHQLPADFVVWDVRQLALPEILPKEPTDRT